MTTLKYNGITIHDVLTDDVSYEVVRDSTGVDPIYCKIHVSVRGMLRQVASLDGEPKFGLELLGQLGPKADETLEKLLMPRRELLMTVGDQTLLHVLPSEVRPGLAVADSATARRDINHGPEPNARIVEITGTRTARIQFSVTCCVPFCDYPGANSTGLTNFRFWIAESLESESWLTRRVYHGRLRVSHGDVNVHAVLRSNDLIPPLQYGFLRKSVSIQESPNGLELEFTVTDLEQYAAPPAPATFWRGRHTVTTPQPGGATAESEVHVSLSAPKDVDQRDLLSLATRILESKLHFLDLQPTSSSFLLSASYVASLHENAIEANARIKHTIKDVQVLANVLGRDLGTPLDLPNENYDPNIAVIGGQTSTLVGLFVCALQDPCHPASMPQTSTRAIGAALEYARKSGQRVRVQQAPLVPYETKYDPNQRTYPYHRYEMESDIPTQSGSWALPVAQSSTAVATRSVVPIQFYQPTTRRIVRIEAERLNKWPDLPGPESFVDGNGITHTLISHRPIPAAPVLAADGTKTLYASYLEAEYALSRAPRPGESLPVGKLPYRSDRVAVSTVPGSSFLTPGSTGSPI